MEKRRFAHEFALLFLIALAIGVIILQSNFRMTGNVVSNGISCDGNWTCTDWTTCADGNQSRSCSLDVNSNSTNCVSPVTELQNCTMPVTNNTDTTNSTLTNSTLTNSTLTNSTLTNSTLTNSTQVILNSISITSPANKLSYVVGEPLDINGLVVIGTYSNNSTIIEPVSTSDINGFNSVSATTGQVLTITFQGKTATYSVDIVAPATNLTSTNSNSSTNIASPTTTTTPQTNTPPVTAEVTQPVTTCTPNWQCGDWQECITGNQARACTDTNNCGTQEGIPATSQACTVAVTNETKPAPKQNLFSMVGSVVQGPISAVGTFFTNKTNIFIISGALALVVCGFFSFRFFKKHRIKIVKQ